MKKVEVCFQSLFKVQISDLDNSQVYWKVSDFLEANRPNSNSNSKKKNNFSKVESGQLQSPKLAGLKFSGRAA